MDVLPPLPVYLAFIAAAGAIVLMPGPDTVTVLSQGASAGRSAGLWTALGVSGGVLVHTTAVALGLAALLNTAPAAYATLKFAGAAFLVYLGLQTLTTDDLIDHDGDAATRPFRAGFIVNATNPKVAIFFLAFLPSFTVAGSATSVAAGTGAGAGATTGIQLLALGATYSVLSGIYLGIVGTAAGTFTAVFDSPRAQRSIRILSGVALLVLAGVVAIGAGP